MNAELELLRPTVPAGAVAIAPARPWWRSTRILLGLILLVSGTAIITAMRRTSTTFDEIVLVAGGARGFHTGVFDLAPDHPPLMQYLYGLPVALTGPQLPDESNLPETLRQSPSYRYRYAAAFYWQVGNDPERIAFLGRLPAVCIALGLVLVTFAFVRRYWGDGAALLAAALVAFLPDVLAHGGIAYNDLPVALSFFAAAWAIDSAIRTTSYRRAALAGALTGLAIGVKISAAALLPVAVALIVSEAVVRSRRGTEPADPGMTDRGWWTRIAAAAGIATVAAYLTVALIYRGDFALHEFRYGLAFRYQHLSGGHGAAAFLLGQKSTTGWWYFFPVAFWFKTSAGLHVLLVIAVLQLVLTALRAPVRFFASGLRMPVLAILVFGAALLTSRLNIGFRYALPVLPLLCVIIAVGTRSVWRSGARLVRITTVAAVVWAITFPLTYYPHFIAFISEYGPERNQNHRVLIDSSLDWGQGLLELRDFMRSQSIPRVYLSYFGSAYPAGYGIEYVPLASFFGLPPRPAPDRRPEYVVISATNLEGVYLGDPFAEFRRVLPDTVLGYTMFVYRLRAEGTN